MIHNAVSKCNVHDIPGPGTGVPDDAPGPERVSRLLCCQAKALHRIKYCCQIKLVKYQPILPRNLPKLKDASNFPSYSTFKRVKRYHTESIKKCSFHLQGLFKDIWTTASQISYFCQ
jgi:hypothetical protein